MSDQHSSPIMGAFPHPRAGKEMKIILVSLLLLAAGAGGIFLVLRLNADGKPVTDYREAVVTRRDLDSRLELSGSLEVRSRRTLYAPADCTVISVLAEAGAAVAEGQVILTLESEELEESVRDTGRQLRSAILERDRKKAAFVFRQRKYELERAAKFAAVEAERRKLETEKELYAVNAVSRKEYETAAEKLEERVRELAGLDLEREEFERMHSFEVESADRLIAGLEEEALRLSEAQLKLTVRAPYAGTVISVEVTAGTDVRKDAGLASVADMETLAAVFRVNETSVYAISPGMPVAIGYGKDSYPGTVVSIGTEALPSSDGGPARIEVEADFESIPAGAIIGSTISGTVLLGRIEGALVLPRGPYLSSGGGRYVYVIRGDHAYRTSCAFGTTEGILVEVLSGLEENDRVIVSEYEPFASREKIRLGRKTE